MKANGEHWVAAALKAFYKNYTQLLTFSWFASFRAGSMHRREGKEKYEMYRLVALIGVVLVFFLALGMPSGLASVHTYPEGTDRVMYRSLQTLRDRTAQAWQVVFYKRVQGGKTESIHLRLVGFPGGSALEHPHALKITTGTERVWMAAETAPVTNTANIAEYDLFEVMRQLNSTTPLRLTLPLEGTAIELPIPPFVVEEWRQVAQR